MHCNLLSYLLINFKKCKIILSIKNISDEKKMNVRFLAFFMKIFITEILRDMKLVFLNSSQDCKVQNIFVSVLLIPHYKSYNNLIQIIVQNEFCREI